MRRTVAHCFSDWFDFSGLLRHAPEIEIFSSEGTKTNDYSVLSRIHQIGAVIRSGEYRPGENRFGGSARSSVFSPSRITRENNEKIRPQPDRENAFAGASGGGNGTAVEPSLGRGRKALVVMLPQAVGTQLRG